MKDERGASLIEVLGASTILGIVVVAFLYVSQYMALADRATDMETKALRLAEEKLSFANVQVQEHGTLPANEPDAGGFAVVYQMTALGDGDDPAVYDAQLFGPKHLSLQTVVLAAAGGQQQPALLTVTVSWGDET